MNRFLKTFLLFIIWGIAIPSEIFLLAQESTVSLYPVGDVTTWPSTTYRWKDIADNLYSESYRSHEKPFPYDQATVSLTYHTLSNMFRGTLDATGLKPNFAYQIKLVGKPTSDPDPDWEGSGDDWSNEKIGYQGRWWRKQPNPGNSNDADYNAHKTDPNYVFEGYLLFDFFITNHLGSASKNFAADASFHVLWNTVLNSRTRQSNDSEIRYHEVIGYSSSSHGAYSSDVGPKTVGIYAEWEPGRATPGNMQLPDGNYNVRFILTEESFHQSGLGGYWAAAMGYNDIQFTVDSSIPVELTQFSAQANHGVVMITWATASETENLGFHIYRSLSEDGDYAKITHNLIPSRGNSEQTQTYAYTDNDVTSNHTYYYKLGDINWDGRETLHGPISVTLDRCEIEYVLSQNYPNPFNQKTSIHFTLPEAGWVTLTIYNLNGQLVKTLINNEMTSGDYNVIWDGTDSKAEFVVSGIYITTLNTPKIEKVYKMILLR